MTFANPAFLWGLLAVLIPIAIHLFNFHRYRTVYFSNVDRLAELHTESRRSSQMRRLLLLAFRILAVVFLVLAFARPVIPNRNSTMRGGTTVVSVYLDNTYSMESASSEGSLIDESVRKAREIVSAHAIGDRYQLLTSDLNGIQMRWLSRDEFLEVLDDVKPSPASPRLSDAVRRQLDFMRQSGAANRYAYVISDFQRAGSDLDALPTDSIATVTLVPLQGVETDNLFIDTLQLDAPAYFAGGNVSVKVTVRNSGTRDAERVPLKLSVNGHERAISTIDVQAGGTAQSVMRFAIDAKGWLDGNVTIEDYPVTFDDSYFFTFRVNDRINMLEVHSGTPNESLQRLFADDSVVDLHTTTHLPASLDDIDFIVLNEMAAMPSGEVQLLAEWVDNGGTLLAVPGADRPVPAALLDALHAPQNTHWSNATLRARSIDYANSLYRNVFSATDEDMEMPVVQGHYTHAASTALSQTIIELADGSDLLSVTPCGKGRLYLMTTPLRSEFTDFVGQALFVPTLYNMALYSRPLPPPAYTLGDTEPIVLVDTYDPDNPPSLTLNTEHLTLNTIPDLRHVGNRHMMVLHGELTEGGIYTLADEHLAFNSPRRESEMSFFTPEEVAEAIKNHSGYSVIANASRHLGDELRARDSGRQLWRLCIILALLALAAETVLLKLNKRTPSITQNL